MAKRNISSKLCPGSPFFYEPTLKALDMLGGSGSNGEIYKKVLEITNLSKKIIEEMHTFTMSEVEYKLMWARTYLKNFGAVESSKQGVWALTVKKKSGDGGIDGTGKLRIQGIFSFNVAFQCKRYKGKVGAPEIRDFRGSLDQNIEKGVLITTGSFTQDAKDEASSPGKRVIDLMDGEELISKMAEYGIGLNEVKSYEIDEDFFNSLEAE